MHKAGLGQKENTVKSVRRGSDPENRKMTATRFRCPVASVVSGEVVGRAGSERSGPFRGHSATYLYSTVLQQDLNTLEQRKRP